MPSLTPTAPNTRKSLEAALSAARRNLAGLDPVTDWKLYEATLDDIAAGAEALEALGWEEREVARDWKRERREWARLRDAEAA
ncbi:MAG: hypothetical protein K2X36_03490 [Microbacteriaceae bacterium]|nr:hypothetical protein [Microbacteriaceae bacterium]